MEYGSVVKPNFRNGDHQPKQPAKYIVLHVSETNFLQLHNILNANSLPVKDKYNPNVQLSKKLSKCSRESVKIMANNAVIHSFSIN